VNIAKPKKPMACSGLALASEKTAFGSMLSPVQPE
jgi:hypothetical protein